MIWVLLGAQSFLVKLLLCFLHLCLGSFTVVQVHVHKCFCKGQAVIFLLRLKATSWPWHQYFAGNWVRKAHHEQFWFTTAVRVISRTISQGRELCFADIELVSLEPRNHLSNLTASWTCSSWGSPWKSLIWQFSGTLISLQSQFPSKAGTAVSLRGLLPNKWHQLHFGSSFDADKSLWSKIQINSFNSF